MARRTTHRGDRRIDARQIDAVFALVEDDMRAAVAETLRDPSPEPARAVIDAMLDADDEIDAGPGEPPPGETLALLVASRWLTAARDRTDVDTPRVLDWIGEHLGSRYRARARYVRGMLDGNASEAMQYADALGDDFLPALLWLAAGTVACHGDGDAAWLQ